MELFLLWGASPYERSPKGGANSEAQEGDERQKEAHYTCKKIYFLLRFISHVVIMVTTSKLRNSFVRVFSTI